MTLIAANVSNLMAAAGTLRTSGAGAGLSCIAVPSLGDGAADGALAGFSAAWSVRTAALDALVEAAGSVLAIYAVNFGRAGG